MNHNSRKILPLYLIRLFASTLLIPCVYLFFLLFTADYPTLVQRFIMDHSSTFTIDDFGNKYFTVANYAVAQAYTTIVMVFLLASNWLLWKKNSFLSTWIISLIQELAHLLASYYQSLVKLSLKEKLLILPWFGCILAIRIIYFERFPFNGDELMSYLVFVKNGFFVTGSYFPSSNNHVLYNLLCIPFDYIWNDPLWVMRAPNVGLNLLLLLFIFTFIYRNFGFPYALLALIFSGLSFCTTIYAVHGRGYMLSSLFTVVAAFSFLKLIQTPNTRTHLSIFIFSSIAGLYTNFSFILIFLSFLVMGILIAINKQVVLLRLLLLSCLWVALGTFLLYSPAYIVSSFKAVHFNEQLSMLYHQGYTTYLTHIFPVATVETIDYILGTVRGGYLLVPLIGLLVFLAWKRESSVFIQRWYQLVLISLVLTMGLFVLQKFFPDYRVFTYVGFIFYITISFTLLRLLDKTSYRFKIAFCWVIGLALLVIIPYQYPRKMSYFYENDYLDRYKKLDQEVKNILSMHPKNILVNEKTFNLYLQYYCSKTRLKTHFDVIPQPGIAYDFIILEEEGIARYDKREHIRLNTIFSAFIYYFPPSGQTPTKLPIRYGG